MINYLIAILFGIVEGISEWLPISSTAHLLLLKSLVPFDVSNEFYKLFEVVIQLGAILAVIILFWDKLFPFKYQNKHIYNDLNVWRLWIKIFIACVPAAIIGLSLDDYLDKLFYRPLAIALALIVFGLAFIIVEKRLNRRAFIHKLSGLGLKEVVLIGLFQIVAAIFPGTSRSGTTIIMALLLGVSRSVATEFTFCLALPTMAGASLLKLLKYKMVLTVDEIGLLLVAMLVAFIISLLVIKSIITYIRRHNFIPFGIYRIVLGILVIIYFANKGALWVNL